MIHTNITSNYPTQLLPIINKILLNCTISAFLQAQLVYRLLSSSGNGCGLIESLARADGSDALQLNGLQQYRALRMMQKVPLYDSFKPGNQEEDITGSSLPLRNLLTRVNSQIMDSEDEARTEILKTTNKGEDKASVMENIPLLLEMRKNGIVGDNLVSQDRGISKWKIGKMIGGGGSGRVYKALNVTNGILSAVKKIHLCEQDEEQSKSEIAILSKIHHENIVRYLQHYQCEDETWIFMEYVPGTLKNFYKDFGPPPLETFLHFAKQLITALDYLHNHKIVHKDLKCANVLLTSKGVLKLSDFGCSKGFDHTISFVYYEKEGSKTQKGTSYWMSPETIMEGNYTRKTDIWSLGCTLLELATGQIPWSEKNLDNNKIMLYIGQTQQIPLIPDSLPQKIQALIKKCVNRDPDLRSTTDELLALLA